MLTQTIEIVVNNSHEGFSLDAEMAIWLMENKNWRITENQSESEDPLYDLFGIGDHFWASAKYDDIEFRTNHDLIECIKSLKEHYNKLSLTKQWWIKGEEPKFLDLEIKKIKLCIDVDDIGDGKEQVSYWIEEE